MRRSEYSVRPKIFHSCPCRVLTRLCRALSVSLRVFAACLQCFWVNYAVLLLCLCGVCCVLHFAVVSAVTLPYPWLPLQWVCSLCPNSVVAPGDLLRMLGPLALRRGKGRSLRKSSQSMIFSQRARHQTLVALDVAPATLAIRPFRIGLIAEILRDGPFRLFACAPGNHKF